MCFISFIALAIFAFLTCTVTDAFGEKKKSTCQKKKGSSFVFHNHHISSNQREQTAASLALVFVKGCSSAIYNKPVIYLTH